MTISLKELLLSADPVAELKALHKKGELAALDPSLAALEMSIPAGYHHKDNLQHSFQVLQNAIDREVNGADLILRTAALFHDIGKPKTREFGAKGVVTFTMHELVGAKLVKRILPKHGYSKEELESISLLVLLHMRSHTFKEGWSESAVRRLATDAGSNLQLERLIVVFYSDVTSSHFSRKSGIHSSLDELSDELARVKKSDARAALRPALDGREVAELLNIELGPELGKVMRFLNSDENVGLSRDATVELLKKKFLS